MKNLSIKWKSSEEDNLFERLGSKIENPNYKPKALNLDIMVGFKEATLTPMADVIIKKLETKINNNNILFVTNVIIYSLLRAITNESFIADDNKIKIFPNNEFRELKTFFKETSFGTVYIDKADINDATLLELLNIMCLEGIFEEESDKYYLIGYHLEHLEIG
jgi:hypothetical protein